MGRKRGMGCHGKRQRVTTGLTIRTGSMHDAGRNGNRSGLVSAPVAAHQMMENAGMEPPPNLDSSPPTAPGILLVTVDRLPAWMLSAWGATWVSTPACDALAARGVVFDRLVVSTLDPAAVCHDLLGGTGPESILGRAAAAGWRPVVVTDDPLLLAGGAGQVAGTPPEAASGAEVHVVPAVASRRSAREEPHTNLARLCTVAEQFIASGRHRLVWVHATSLGVAWDAPESFREAYIDPEDPPPPVGARVPYLVADAAGDPDAIVGIRQVFAGQLTLLDRCLARLFAALPRQESGPQWGVMLAGVRGLPLGIHGVVGCAADAFELPWGEVVHVPAILVDPAGRMAGQRYGGLVVPADLGATLAGMVAQLTADAAESIGGPVTADVLLPDRLPQQGRDLGGLLSAWASPQRDRVVVATPEALALITPHWHCLLLRPRPSEEPAAPRLYAKPDDAFELSDVANRCAAVTEEFQALAARVWAEGIGVAWSAQLSQAAAASSGGFE